MAYDTSDRIGATQPAGTFVMPKGTTRRLANGGAGIGVGAGMATTVVAGGLGVEDRLSVRLSAWRWG
jgi:hypothetical protein